MALRNISKAPGQVINIVFWDGVPVTNAPEFKERGEFAILRKR